MKHNNNKRDIVFRTLLRAWSAQNNYRQYLLRDIVIILAEPNNNNRKILISFSNFKTDVYFQNDERHFTNRLLSEPPPWKLIRKRALDSVRIGNALENREKYFSNIQKTKFIRSLPAVRGSLPEPINRRQSVAVTMCYAMCYEHVA